MLGIKAWVYAICSTKSDRVYVGASINYPTGRFSVHKSGYITHIKKGLPDTGAFGCSSRLIFLEDPEGAYLKILEEGFYPDLYVIQSRETHFYNTLNSVNTIPPSRISMRKMDKVEVYEDVKFPGDNHVYKKCVGYDYTCSFCDSRVFVKGSHDKHKCHFKK